MVNIVRKWWKEGTAYQIWPASYKDSNGDGIGDIPGIISTLDYLKDLGVDIIWVSPAFASPQKDMGYDVSNYEDIDPQYGTLADAEKLIAECHKRGMKLLFDLVINHTSDQHAWFKESRSSKDNPKRDWYIWRPPRFDADGKRQPPTNWRAIFGGSAWEWDEGTQEYYLHLFVPEQPDLNWENPETREAIYKSAVRFWLDKGLDGFRIDTSNLYSKPTDFKDAPIVDPKAEYQIDPDTFCNGPRIHEFLQELHDKAFAGYDMMSVGELAHNPHNSGVLKYVSAAERQMNMVFQFEVVDLAKNTPGDRMNKGTYKLEEFKKAFAHTVELASDPNNDAWGTAFLENHDQPRSVSRFVSDEEPYRARGAKLLALMLVASSGTLFIYQGQEIGVRNLPLSWKEEDFRDVEVKNYIEEWTARGRDHAQIMENLHFGARDHSRNPVPWSAEAPNGGFTTKDAKPWMPVDQEFTKGWNVADEQGDPESVLAFWKTAVRLRKEHPGVFVYGSFRVCDAGGEQLFVYEKEDVAGFDAQAAADPAGGAAAGGTSGQHVGSAVARETNRPAKAIVVLNFTAQKQPIQLEKGQTLGKVLLGNVDNGQGDPGFLEPWEGRIYEST